MQLRSGKVINTEIPVFRPRIRRPSYRSQSSTSSFSPSSVVPVAIDICSSASASIKDCESNDNLLSFEQEQEIYDNVLKNKYKDETEWKFDATTCILGEIMPHFARHFEYKSVKWMRISREIVKDVMKNSGLDVCCMAMNVINCKRHELGLRIEITIEYLRLLYWILHEKPYDIDKSMNLLNRISCSQTFYDALKRKGETEDEFDSLFPECVTIGFREKGIRLRCIYDLVMASFDPCVYVGKGIQDLDVLTRKIEKK